MAKCSFCGNNLKEGLGKMHVMNTGQILFFCSSKCQKNQMMGRSPKKFKWARGPKKTKDADK